MRAKESKRISFAVDETSDVPLWVQLRNRIAYLISSGYLEPGDALPTVRALASEASINYNTVNKAYLGLKSDGLIESTPGRGTIVSSGIASEDDAQFQQIDRILQECIASCRDLGLSFEDIQRRMNAKLASLKGTRE